jgi:Sec-independent protein translocase protein TatA
MYHILVQPMHLLIIVCVALLIFGPGKLNDLSKGVEERFKDGEKRNPEKVPPSTFGE